MRWLIVPTMLLAAAVPLKDCGTVKIDGPKTAECPEGRYIVTADQTQDPPLVSYRCEKPKPTPTPTPACPEGQVWYEHGGPHQTSGCVPAPFPSPSASAAPSPTPVPSASPVPTPRPSPTIQPSSPGPSPSSSPTAAPAPGLTDACPAPFAVKLGFGQNPRGLNPGFANTGSITPLVSNTETNRQPCAYRGLTGPKDTCAASEGCADHVGSPYEVTYGQPSAVQSLAGGFQNDPIERSTDGCTVIVNGVPHVPCGYNLKFATGGAENYVAGRYREAGHMRVCVTLPPLPTWRCQEGEMGADGKFSGFGQDNRSTDVPK
jgi:hypothetical protein